MKHLWEVDHAYYCNEGNYFNNDCGEEFKSLADYLEEMGDADFDCNLLFRWDWVEENDDGDANFSGDVNYRNGKLKLFWMHQRKGKYVYHIIEVCRADEGAVIAYLLPRMRHLMALWEPLSLTKEPTQ